MKFEITRTSNPKPFYFSEKNEWSWLQDYDSFIEAIEGYKPCIESKYEEINEEGIYTIEFNTIEELLSYFENIKERIVLTPKNQSEYGLPCIEIYDSYRE